MAKQNYCQVGTPVQYFSPPEYKPMAAIISNITGSEVSMWVFPHIDSHMLLNHGELPKPFIAWNVRHADFIAEWQPYWNYIPEEHPKS